MKCLLWFSLHSRILWDTNELGNMSTNSRVLNTFKCLLILLLLLYDLYSMKFLINLINWFLSGYFCFGQVICQLLSTLLCCCFICVIIFDSKFFTSLLITNFIFGETSPFLTFWRMVCVCVFVGGKEGRGGVPNDSLGKQYSKVMYIFQLLLSIFTHWLSFLLGFLLT